jgi:hypothetical protein
LTTNGAAVRTSISGAGGNGGTGVVQIYY